MKLLILDLLPDYINFEVQATQSDGTTIDPTGTPTVSIYEESGGDGSFDNSQLSSSPFTLAKINSKTGNYGVLVDKSEFTAGKIYRALFELTVDGVATAKTETYFATNSSNLKADVSNLDALVSSRATPANITTAHATTDGKIDVVDSNVDSIKATVENVTYGLSALKTILDGIKGAGWTDETLKAIKDAVDSGNTEGIDNFHMRAGEE